MKVLSPVGHGVLDYLLIVFLAMAPAAAALSGPYALACYAVAACYLLVVLITNFPLGIGRFPYRSHGRLEAISGGALLLAPFLFGFASANPVARNLFMLFGAALLLLWLLTDWSGRAVSDDPADNTTNLVGRVLE